MPPESATTHESTSDSTDNPIANVNIYWKVSALALTAVALLGLTINAIGGNNAYIPNAEVMESILVFDWTHNVVHVLLAGVAAAFGFGSLNEKLSINAARTIGVVYIALGVVGFVPPVVEALDSLIGLSLEAGENIIHLTLGVWGAYAGFTS